MKTRYGIIGCGNIARFHFEGLEKINARIVHVADIDEKKAATWAKKFDARYTTDYRDLLNDPEVTVVSILTPMHTHICLAAIRASKDIICEKTLANSAAEAYEIVQAARATDCLFFTAYMKRFFPAVQKAKELIPSLGTLFSAHARSYQCWGDLYSAPNTDSYQRIVDSYGGAITKCAGSHVLDLVLFLLGRPASVYGNIDYIPNSKVDRKTIALLEYPTSLVVNFEAATHPLTKIGFERNSWEERIEITGTKGRLELHTVIWDRPENNAARLIHYDETRKAATEHRFDSVNPFHLEVAQFHQALMNRNPAHPDLIDGFNVDVLIEGIEKSHARKQPVTLDWMGF